jgi:predicted enzyme related to lactoylglutathione lyase
VLKRIKFTTVYVEDQDRALDFYTAKLGLRVFTDQPMGPDARWIELEVPGAETKLVLWKQKDFTPGPMPAVVFVAPNVQKAYEELKAKGVEFLQPPTKQQWGESAMLKDSEGNLVMFGTA